MTLWGYLELVLLVGAVSVAFALAVTILVHSIAGIFNLGRKTAKYNPWISGPRT